MKAGLLRDNAVTWDKKSNRVLRGPLEPYGIIDANLYDLQFAYHSRAWGPVAGHSEIGWIDPCEILS
jgi:hypothetical protein